MPDVDESTLKKNIGHLPSSVLFGEEGLCILMGHRDTDFHILQYVKNGDIITVKSGDKEYEYMVNSDAELRFYTDIECNLVLVTCYPFRYSGYAPKKYVIFTNTIN